MESETLRYCFSQQPPHDFRVTFDCQQQCPGRRIERASTLLPIAQRGDRQMKRVSKLHLRHAEALPQHLDARDPAHPGQFLRSERLGVGVG